MSSRCTLRTTTGSLRVKLLVELDPSTYQVAVSQARGNVAQAASQLAAQSPEVPISQPSNQTAAVSSQTELELHCKRSKWPAASTMLRWRICIRQKPLSTEAATDEARYRGLVVKDEVSIQLYDQNWQRHAPTQHPSMHAARQQKPPNAIAEVEDRVTRTRSQLAETQSNNPVFRHQLLRRNELVGYANPANLLFLNTLHRIESVTSGAGAHSTSEKPTRSFRQ